MKAYVVLVLYFLCAPFLLAQTAPKKTDSQASICPAHEMLHREAVHSHNGMNDRGAKGMGFSQTETTHHFLLTQNGGVIQVEANNAQDAADRDNIKMHLNHIAHAFESGDFDIPMFVHDQTPPGVPMMKQHAKDIRYTVEETPNGGRVVIQTDNKDTLAAIHQFLQFQIREHQTGDPLN